MKEVIFLNFKRNHPISSYSVVKNDKKDFNSVQQ